MLEIDRPYALTFTGQGSQREGMWDDLRESPIAVKIFDMTDEIMGFRLSELCSKDPLGKLAETRYAQPAIVAHSLAAYFVARDKNPEFFATPPLFVAGHSVGEISALVAAGSADVAIAIELAKQRGELMQDFGGEGGMVALMGVADDEELKGALGNKKVWIGNYNCPGQRVVTGEVQEVQRVKEWGDENVKLAKTLPISIAAHSPLMDKAQEAFEPIVYSAEIYDPLVPIVLNGTAEGCVSGLEIKAGLIRQFTNPVYWEQSVLWMIAHGSRVFIEFGPTDHLSGLLRRINREAIRICVRDYQSALALKPL